MAVPFWILTERNGTSEYYSTFSLVICVDSFGILANLIVMRITPTSIFVTPRFHCFGVLSNSSCSLLVGRKSMIFTLYHTTWVNLPRTLGVCWLSKLFYKDNHVIWKQKLFYIFLLVLISCSCLKNVTTNALAQNNKWAFSQF